MNTTQNDERLARLEELVEAMLQQLERTLDELKPPRLERPKLRVLRGGAGLEQRPVHNTGL
jgi:hypothetical protein